MRTLARIASAAALCLCAAALWATAASAAAEPAWNLTLTPVPANFAPGGESEFLALATNVGAAQTNGTAVKIEVSLPAGMTFTKVSEGNSDPSRGNEFSCEATDPQTVLCETKEAIHPGRYLVAKVAGQVSASSGTLLGEASVSGGGATQAVSAQAPAQVQAGPVPFDFLVGFKSPLSDEEGKSVPLAGAHPYQQTIDFGFPTENAGGGITNAGHPRDFYVELPKGMVGDPASTPVLCTEAELITPESCPQESQVGVADVTSLLGEAKVGSTAPLTSNLFNMVPPRGAAAELATNVAETGIYSHIILGVRSDSDYGIEAATHDVLAFGQQPIFNVQAQIWGDPSAEAHDSIRGNCLSEDDSCPAEEKAKAALLTLPGSCPGTPPVFRVRADSWEKPSPPNAERETSYASADLAGASPVSVEHCDELKFEPTIEVHPTTNLTDSPSGLDFKLHQPQDMKVDSRATATLRDAAITFPAGLAVNPSQAAGLGACSEAQIGFEERTEAGRLDFSKAPQACPNAAKIGNLEAVSPLLVARNADHKVEKDIEENPVPEPLHGSVYIAKPFANPFKSLITVYLVIEDEKTGIVAKVAAEGKLDPQSGQITTYVKENPELPLEDIKVHLFGGSRGALVTPPVCAPGGFTTEAVLTPWSSPEGKDAFPEASFQTTASPRGEACPASEAQVPSAFKLNAGTENPSAGKYSPLLFKISREPNTQRLGRIESTLPRGVIAKLAGVGTCSEAQIAKARSREEPEKGALEQADPSCPASSQVGTIIGAAGAGPNPYYTTGHAYLAGPYKGAPISIVGIVPAVAGPFDLGTVVSRIAVYLDPVTAEVRAVSDPLPTILDGVPLDLRSVALRADRPSFSLNPTSCNEKSFGGQAISTLGQAVPLFQRFQVGGCKSLPYKPKMSVRLFGPTHRGAHPRLKAVLTAKPGEANTAAVSFTFPKSEFIDQAHFRTICTRVQFAAGQCPAGSVYGHVKVISPLVDYTLEGPAYLRSSSHKLPDLVVALHGPPSQPIELDAAGRVDSVNGGLRVRFQEVPDAPFTKLIFDAQGAKKGLFQNSTNICKGTHRATLKLDAQSGKVYDTQPKLVAQCKGSSKKKPKKGRH